MLDPVARKFHIRESLAGLPIRWIVMAAGALGPDLLDKPLFYLTRGSVTFSESIITSTRTFGHTTLVPLSFLLVHLVWRSPWILLFSLGWVTHLALDLLQDLSLYETGTEWVSSTWMALQYGWVGWTPKFYVADFERIHEHLNRTPWLWIVPTEALGLVLLVLLIRRHRHTSE
jgi:hypothetical protein